jgi:hypothetical protein
MSDEPLRKTIWTVRYGVPAGLALIGLVILGILQSSAGVEAWAMFTGAALAVLLLNVLYRIGARGDHERDVEASARDYYDAHGAWPTTTAASGRNWRLPAGVVTLEAEEAAAARRAATERDASDHAAVPARDAQPPAEDSPPA